MGGVWDLDGSPVSEPGHSIQTDLNIARMDPAMDTVTRVQATDT
jgi:hypothetical protein